MLAPLKSENTLSKQPLVCRSDDVRRPNCFNSGRCVSVNSLIGFESAQVILIDYLFSTHLDLILFDSVAIVIVFVSEQIYWSAGATR